jgi:hypothetical protein
LLYLYKKINSTKCLLQSRLVLTNNVQKIYIQLISITKTRNGKLVALGLKATTAGKA